ncbi:MAG: O-antigen polymerase [Armatimonadota bacterium]
MLTTIIFILSGFKLDFSFVSGVYEKRFAARDIFADGTFFAYILGFLRSSLSSITFGIALFENSKKYLILSIYIIFVIFSIEGTRMTIIMPILLFLIYYITIKRRKNFAYLLLTSLTLFIVISIAENLILKSSFLVRYFVLRQMALTSLISGYYWEFFTSNPFVYMQDSLLRFIIPIASNYDLPSTRLIGELYFGDENINANVNIWMSGYANFGYLGMIITSLIAAFILRVIDIISSEEKFTLGCICAGSIGIIWTNNSLHTSLLTHGVFILILGLYLYPNYNIKNKTKEKICPQQIKT